MVFYLDSNAWIKIFNQPGLNDKLLDLHLQGKLDISVSAMTADELSVEENIEISVARQNRALLKPFIGEMNPDSIAVIGYSRIGFAKIPSEQSANVYDDHLRKKALNKNSVRDGIHVSNSLELGSIMVPSDTQVMASCQKNAMDVMCFSEFLEINDLGTCAKCNNCI